MFDYDEASKLYLKWYSDKSRISMIEDIFTTFDMTKNKNVPFLLFPQQKDFLCALRDHRNNLATKPRQTGVSTSVSGFLAAELALADPTAPLTVVIVGNKLELSRLDLQKIREFLMQVPRWVWGDEFFDPNNENSKKNRKEIFKISNQNELILFNGSRVIAKSSGPDASRGVSSVSWLVFDEAAFIENGDKVYASTAPLVSTGGHVIMISTPNGRDALYYKTYEQSKLGKNNFHVTSLSWYKDPRYNKFLKWYKKDEETGEFDFDEDEVIDSAGSVAYNEPRWRKLVEQGYKPTSPWYINACETANNDTMKIAQEYDVSFLGSANNVVPPEFIEMQEKMNVREPDMIDPDVEETWMWSPPIEGHHYIMGVDSGRGDGADTTTIEIIDLSAVDENGMPTFEQVLEFQGKITGDIAGQLAFKYGMMYGEAFAVFDCVGGYGDTAVLTMRDLKYKNLYYDDTSLNKYMMQTSGSKLTPVNGKMPGFHSNAVRYQMLSNFANMIKNNAVKIRSSRVIAELGTWVYINGKQDHQDGSHDDTITNMAMAFFVMQHSMDKVMGARAMEEAMLKAWGNIAKNNGTTITQTTTTEISIRPTVNSGWGTSQTYSRTDNTTSLGWLFR
jgi:hypothetical protein